VLSSFGLPLPPTCLLLTVSEARSYFASTIQTATKADWLTRTRDSRCAEPSKTLPPSYMSRTLGRQLSRQLAHKAQSMRSIPEDNTTRRNTPEDSYLHICSSENLKSHLDLMPKLGVRGTCHFMARRLIKLQDLTSMEAPGPTAFTICYWHICQLYWTCYLNLYFHKCLHYENLHDLNVNCILKKK
jgi:hypothetical protein